MVSEPPIQLRSIYIDLLDAALKERTQFQGVPAISEALVELERRRSQLVGSEKAREHRGWATSAVADQLAYDVALVRYARCLEIDCEPDRFGWPQDERRRLERVLATRGLPWG